MQIMIMCIIVQGIGAADAVWSAAINSNSLGAAYAAQLSTGNAVLGVKDNLSMLFSGLVCEATSTLDSIDYGGSQIRVPNALPEVNLKRSRFTPGPFDPNSSTYESGE